MREELLPIVGQNEAMKADGLKDRTQEQKEIREEVDILREPGDSAFDEYEGGNSEEVEEEEVKDDGDIYRLNALGYKDVNTIEVGQLPKITGHYPKVANRRFLKKKQKERAIRQRNFNLGVDIFLYKNVFRFPKEHLEEMEEHYKSQAQVYDEDDSLNETVSLSDYSFEEKAQTYTYNLNKKDNFEVRYEELPGMDECRYIPQPFRNKFEISYWRLNKHNVVKVKSYYFTPRNQSDIQHYTASLSLDKTHICVVTKEKGVNKSRVSIFLLKDISEEDIKWNRDDHSYEKNEEKYRQALEIDIDTFDSKMKTPFGKGDKQNETAFEYTLKELKGKDENFGDNVICWGQGRYVLSKITTSYKLTNGFGFKLYDTRTKEEIGYFLRRNYEDLTNFIQEIKVHPNEDNTLVFILNKIDTFQILEIDMDEIISEGKKTSKSKLTSAIYEVVNINKTTDFLTITDDLKFIYYCSEDGDGDKQKLQMLNYKHGTELNEKDSRLIANIGNLKRIVCSGEYLFAHI